MSLIKTAISLDEDLFRKANDLSRNMDISRSKLFQYALINYIAQYENRKLLDAINEVYSTEAAEEDKKLRKAMKDYHKKIIKDKW
jgi:metal-responsive CopG/Arc/MetJ family transcriptional regulator